MNARAPAASRWAGRGLVLVVTAVLSLNVIWIARHWEELRPVAAGDAAPPFDLPQLSREGRELSARVGLSTLRGRVLLIDFWASWCKPCRDSMPLIEELYQRYRDRGFEVVSIKTDGPNMGRASKAVRATTFAVVLDDEEEVAARYTVSNLPHLVLVDRHGVVRHVHRGGAGVDQLASQIEELLSEQ